MRGSLNSSRLTSSTTGSAGTSCTGVRNVVGKGCARAAATSRAAAKPADDISSST
jgi:hypothetical protein